MANMTRDEENRIEPALKRELETDTDHESSRHIYGATIINGGFVVQGDYHVHHREDTTLSQRRQLLDSLYFPEMNSRYNQIQNSAFDTYEWIFQRQPLELSDDRHGDELQKIRDERERHEKVRELLEWFDNDVSMFVVQGKPGSGKSTFMKFLAENRETKSVLSRDATELKCVILFHSFWRAGTTLQHSMKGFCLSIVHQILSSQSQASMAVMVENVSKRSFHDWHEQELRDLLPALIRDFPDRLALFLDGLDEFDPDVDIDKLLDCLSTFADLAPQTKICLSTRPEHHILDQLGFISSVRLQDLTALDIRSVVSQTLKRKIARIQKSSLNSVTLERMTNTICEKAEGVFMWVHYVLQNIVRGVRHHDDLQTLQRRIQALPSALGKLYAEMWSRQNADNPAYQKEAAQLLRLVEHLPLPLYTVLLLQKPQLCQQQLDSYCMVEYSEEDSDSVALYVHTKSAGLLEVFSDSTRLGYILRQFAPIHRSVLDFLRDSDASSIVSSLHNAQNEPFKPDTLMSFRLAYTVQLLRMHSGNDYTRWFYADSIIDMIHDISQLEPVNHTALFDSVERVLTRGVELMPGCYGPWNLIVGMSDCCFTSFTECIVYWSKSFPWLRYLLQGPGMSWSSYYKGRLCLIAGNAFSSDPQASLQVIQGLYNFESDLRSPQLYAGPSVHCMYVPVLSPALSAILCFLLATKREMPWLESLMTSLNLLSHHIDEEATFPIFRAELHDGALFDTAPFFASECLFSLAVILRAKSFVSVLTNLISVRRCLPSESSLGKVLCFADSIEICDVFNPSIAGIYLLRERGQGLIINGISTIWHKTGDGQGILSHSHKLVGGSDVEREIERYCLPSQPLADSDLNFIEPLPTKIINGTEKVTPATLDAFKEVTTENWRDAWSEN